MSSQQELMDTIEELRQSLDGVYAERNLVVALAARLASQLGYVVGIGKDQNTDVGREWGSICYIELPHEGVTKQISWHLHESEMSSFQNLPRYSPEWDGHDTDEKYQRVRVYVGEK